MLHLLLDGLFGITFSSVVNLISQHGYLAIFFLMTLESASLPVPSEVVLPAVGFLVHQGILDPVLSFVTAMIAAIIGMGIDYYVAYYFGKEVVYKHADKFHISKARIVAFDKWFAKNGGFAVFISRLLPVVRGLMSFPAGFAEMPLGKFYFYSIIGTAIWDVLLIGFGYYTLGSSSPIIVVVGVVLFFLILYAIYKYAVKKMR